MNIAICWGPPYWYVKKDLLYMPTCIPFQPQATEQLGLQSREPDGLVHETM